MSDPAPASHQREFHCVHCSGKILIPRDLPPTTGPCPHCGGVITSPPPYVDVPPAPTSPEALAPAPQAAPTYQQLPVSTAIPVSPQAVPAQEIPSPAVIESPPVPAVSYAEKPALQDPVIPIPTPRETTPSYDAPLPQRSSPPEQAPSSKAGMIAVITGILLLLLSLLAAGYYLVAKEMKKQPSPQIPIPANPQKSSSSEAHYLRVGWQKEARETLEKFLSGTTVEEKLPYVINGPEQKDKMESFYGGVEINDSDTPASTYSFTELSDEDKKRGIFMMVYDLPPQFDMKEFFRPLAPIEVQYGMDEADILLMTVAQVKNFATEPLHIQVFFKRYPEGLKLDWETFVQTKYRTFQNFITLPEIGLKSTFRVLISEDVPDPGHAEASYRTYRLIDSANKSDFQRVNVPVDSEVGRALSPLNWRGIANAQPSMRTATVELQWTGDTHNPQLVINRFLCWEYLGLGGELANNPAASK
ncbi:MAG: hypothetical protein QM680_03795 [Luteolibacter sp.]